MAQVGKREFTLHTSRYLKRVEDSGEEVTITHQGEPRLRLIPFKPKTIRDLAGLLRRCEVKGNLHEPVLPRYDRWSS